MERKQEIHELYIHERSPQTKVHMSAAHMASCGAPQDK